MFSLIFLLPLFGKLEFFKKASNKLSLSIGVSFLIGLIIISTFKWSALGPRLEFPMILLKTVPVTPIFMWVGLVFSFSALIGNVSNNGLRLLGFGLLASSGETALLLPLLMAFNLERTGSMFLFLVGALALILELVGAAQALPNGLVLLGDNAILLVLTCCLFLKLKREDLSLNSLLHIAVIVMLVFNYSETIGIRPLVFSVIPIALVMAACLCVYRLDLQKFTFVLSALVCVLLSGNLYWHAPYILVCALMTTCFMGRKEVLREVFKWKTPYIGLLNLIGFYLLTAFLIGMLFQYYRPLGWVSLAGLFFARTGFASLSFYLRRFESSLLGLLFSGLIAGHLFFMAKSIQGAMSW